MANEALYSSISSIFASSVTSMEYLTLAADRNALSNHPALFYGGDLMGKASASVEVPFLGLGGYDLPTAVAENAEVANTSFSNSSVTLTLGKYSKAYEVSDLAKWVDQLGVFNEAQLAADAFTSHQMRLMNLIANVTDDFTSTVSTTGVDLSLASFLAAINALEIANVAPPYLSILHMVQVGDLRSAIATSSGGATQWDDNARAQINQVGGGVRLSLFGVDIFGSNQVPTANAGADRAGAMFGKGAVVWCDSSVSAEAADQMAIGGKILFERDRNAKGALTAYVSHSYLAVSKGLEYGVSIITDA